VTNAEARIEVLPQPRRRLIVLAALAGNPLAFILLIALKDLDVNRWLILACFIALNMITVASLLISYRYACGRIDGRRAHFDEREIELRQQAYALAHRVLATTLVLAVAAVEIPLTNGNTLTLDANTFLPIMIWVIVYIPALPSLMLAWIEPNAVDDA
jgi:hypothetical protein